MRWPFEPPHLTLKPSEKKHKNKKANKKKEKKKPPKKQQKYQKIAFQLSVKFFLFLGGFSNFPFYTLAQTTWTQKPL